MTSIHEFLGKEFRSRYVNPTWIEGMQKEGYAGAGEMRAFVEYLWGWDATVSETVDDAMWDESFQVYVRDKHELGMKAFFESASPFAYQDLTARMIETIRKQYWQADEATRETLLREYVDSVVRHGVSCSEHTCANPRLVDWVVEQGRLHALPGQQLDDFLQAFERAIGRTLAGAKAEADAFVERNEAIHASAPGTAGPSRLEGYRMEVTKQESERRRPSLRIGGPWTALWIAIPLLGILLWWRARSRG